MVLSISRRRVECEHIVSRAGEQAVHAAVAFQPFIRRSAVEHVVARGPVDGAAVRERIGDAQREIIAGRCARCIGRDKPNRIVAAVGKARRTAEPGARGVERKPRRQRGAIAEVRRKGEGVLRVHIAEGAQRHAESEQAAFIFGLVEDSLGDARRIVRACDLDGEQRFTRGRPVARAIVEDIHGLLSLPQRLDRLGRARQGIGISAIGRQCQRSVRASKGAGAGNGQRGSCIHVAIVREDVSRSRDAIVFTRR